MTTPAASPAKPHTPAWIGFAIAPLLTAIATALALGMEALIPAPGLSLIFVLPVVILAVSFGWRSAMTAAVLGVLAFNYFLIEPRYTLRVADPANVWALVLLLGVAAMVSGLADQSRRRAEVATQLAAQATAVQGLAGALVGATDRATVLAETARALGAMLGVPAAALAFDGDDIDQAMSPMAQLTAGDLEAARWAVGSRARARADAFPAENVTYDFWPAGGSRAPAVIGLNLNGGTDSLPPDWERSVAIVQDYLAVALERTHFADLALAARLRTESEKVKADLLAAVSHDLKTPLSSILMSLQSLRRFDAEHDAKARADLLAVAEAETARLNGLVGNLLDMSRIDADALAVKPVAIGLGELVVGARARAGAALDGHKVVVRLEGDLTVTADAGLAETAIANVLENAAKYSPAGKPIEISAAAEDGAVVLIIDDHGPGFPNPAEPLFGKFTRGVEGDGRPPGTGLGLAIARGFLEAQGGRIEAGPRDDGKGGRVRIVLPAARAGRAAA